MKGIMRNAQKGLEAVIAKAIEEAGFTKEDVQVLAVYAPKTSEGVRCPSCGEEGDNVQQIDYTDHTWGFLERDGTEAVFEAGFEWSGEAGISAMHCSTCHVHFRAADDVEFNYP